MVRICLFRYYGPALNETGHQDENTGSAAHAGDEEASEDDWLEREESAEDRHTRYANSPMEEVSDPEEWMEMHCTTQNQKIWETCVTDCVSATISGSILRSI